MRIEICSRVLALEHTASADKKTSVISITSKEERNVEFPLNNNIVSCLHLKFNDLTEEYDEEGIPYGRPLPKQDDFSGLKEFVDSLHCECLLLHCYEGSSRSAAAAQAVYEYRGCVDTVVTYQPYKPNLLVYTFACRELGIQPRICRYQLLPEGTYFRVQKKT